MQGVYSGRVEFFEIRLADKVIVLVLAADKEEGNLWQTHIRL